MKKRKNEKQIQNDNEKIAKVDKKDSDGIKFPFNQLFGCKTNQLKVKEYCLEKCKETNKNEVTKIEPKK